MKNDPNKNIISKLNQIREELEALEQPELKSEFVKSLDDLIIFLNRLRTELMRQSLEEKIVKIREPLEHVISFLESAKSDESLSILLSVARKIQTPKPKRQPVEIPNGLTNEQIREILKKDLSKAELKIIARQRAIAVGKSNTGKIRQDILKNLERQEGYSRLASPEKKEKMDL